VTDFQHTVLRSVSCTGIGLHSGRKVTMSLRPAAAASGIRFRRADLDGVEIPATVDNVYRLDYATGLSRNAETVRTARVQVCARYRPRPEGLPVGQRAEGAAGHGVRAAGPSQRDRTVGDQLPSDAAAPRRDRCDQPRVAATSGADRLSAHDGRRARRCPDRRRACREHAAVLDRVRARGVRAWRTRRSVLHPSGPDRGGR